jgi:hypothetical protein
MGEESKRACVAWRADKGGKKTKKKKRKKRTASRAEAALIDACSAAPPLPKTARVSWLTASQGGVRSVDSKMASKQAMVTARAESAARSGLSEKCAEM